ncbi:MAG: hypothetical protein AAF197_10735 [Pseudomonadota bacterium]
MSRNRKKPEHQYDSIFAKSSLFSFLIFTIIEFLFFLSVHFFHAYFIREWEFSYALERAYHLGFWRVITFQLVIQVLAIHFLCRIGALKEFSMVFGMLLALLVMSIITVGAESISFAMFAIPTKSVFPMGTSMLLSTCLTQLLFILIGKLQKARPRNN